MRRQNFQRLPLIDGFKGLACLVIVLHHLVAYGPLSDAVMPALPDVLTWLFEYGRMAVQVFLVVSGYLMAHQLSQLARQERQTSWFQLVQKRYTRLAIPFVLALLFGVALSSELHWLTGEDAFESIASWPQWIAHVFLLQTWFHQPAIAAGAWYVAIDFQLYALMAGVFCLCQRHRSETRTLWMKPDADPRSLIALVVSWVLVLTLVALVYFNRHPFYDASALYFMGAYGLGMLARWFSTRPKALVWVAGLALLIVFALWFDFRWRLVVAGVTALVLCGESLISEATYGFLLKLRLSGLGKISYSVFLVHFPICMAFNTVWPLFVAGDSVLGNGLGLLAALIASVGMGYVFWRWVESQVPQWLNQSGEWLKALPVPR